LFLVPGYGAQGAPVADTLASFVARGDQLEGGMVSSSRGILYGEGPVPADMAEWRVGFIQRLEAARLELAEHVSIG
jgi:hypothetical protein